MGVSEVASQLIPGQPLLLQLGLCATHTCTEVSAKVHLGLSRDGALAVKPGRLTLLALSLLIPTPHLCSQALQL